MEHQSTMINIEYTILNHYVSLLIHPGSSLSYISPRIMEKCKLKTKKLKITWLVQLTTDTKGKVTSHLKQCPVDLNTYPTEGNLNILPLGSYDVLIGMDWMGKPRATLNCLEETMSWVNHEGQT